MLMSASDADRLRQFLGSGSLEKAGAFLRGAGLVLEEISASRVAGRLELGADHLTPWGIVHGGVYATAIETAASLGASLSVHELGQFAVGLTNTTHFLRPAGQGTARLEAVALHQGRTQQLWRADVTDETGRLVAHGELRLQNLPLQPDPDEA
jgi:1,4-dihydroxy-2-naphthoyl-CoA hydrolase